MEVKINGKELLEELNRSVVQDRKRLTFFISEGLHKRFKELCGVLPASLVLETLMKEFVETAEKKKR